MVGLMVKMEEINYRGEK